MLYSRRDHQHHKGPAIILKKDLEECLLEWKPIKKQAPKSEIQRETHQHNYHPVLHTNKRQ